MWYEKSIYQRPNDVDVKKYKYCMYILNFIKNSEF